MKPIGTAIFGTGFMGRVHLEGVRRVESVEALAIVGRNADTARKLGGGFAVGTIATDYREILRNAAVNAVHVCTPNAQHFSMAKDALLAGKHVLCEKPLATSVEEGEELVALGRETRAAQLRLPQPALLPDGPADAADARSWRPRRHPRGARDLFAGLADV